MKSKMFFFLLLLLFLPIQAKEKIAIAVLPFENATNVQAEDIGSRLASLIEAGLVQEKRFVVIEREKLKKILEEQGITLSGFAEGKVEPGKIKGVDAILMGKVTAVWVVPEKEAIFYTVTVKTKVEATVKLIDVETGEIKLSEVQDGFEKNTLSTGDFVSFPSEEAIAREAEALLEKSTKECAQRIVNRISQVYPLEGKILKVEGKKVWISLGRIHGIKPKQKLLIIALGEVLKDPDTGEIISAVKEVIGELEVTNLQEKVAEAQVKKLEKGKSIKAGDRVQTM